MAVNLSKIGGVVRVTPVAPRLPFSFWQRLEPRARTDDFTLSIQAQVRDPLWMLARQWQFGEFQGDDAGSPVNATIQTQATKLTHVQIGGGNAGVVSLNSTEVPLEAMVEGEGLPLNWRTSVQIGQQLERELGRQTDITITAAQRDALLDEFRRRYPLTVPEGDNLLELDDATHVFLDAVAGRAIDGNAMLEDGLITKNPILPPVLEDARPALGGLWEWYRLLYGEGTTGVSNAWQNERLEYEFQVSAPDPDPDRDRIVLVAPEYDGRRLDWPDFSLHQASDEQLAGDDAENKEDVIECLTVEFIPTPVFFRGMPNHRWWEFEDRQIDFGNLTVNTTDLGKLLLMEFALIHGNDWFLFPLPLPAGSLCFIPELTVTDVFGQTTTIERAGSGTEETWQRWDMYHLSPDGRAAADAVADGSDQHGTPFLFLPPTLPRMDASPPLEEVLFLRDEMANMVWGVERTILNGLGESQSGYEAYRGRLHRLQEQRDREAAAQVLSLAEELGDLSSEVAAAAAAAEATTPEAVASYTEAAEETLRELNERASEGVEGVSDAGEGRPAIVAPIVYRLANTVPENWIPYVPFHTGNNRRAVELRQASMVRNVEDQKPVPVSPRSHLLGTAGAGHRLHEETVSRAARRVRLIVQRSRWIDGSTHVWIGRDTGPGGGEGSSGLRFDIIEDVVE